MFNASCDANSLAPVLLCSWAPWRLSKTWPCKDIWLASCSRASSTRPVTRWLFERESTPHHSLSISIFSPRIPAYATTLIEEASEACAFDSVSTPCRHQRSTLAPAVKLSNPPRSVLSNHSLAFHTQPDTWSGGLRPSRPFWCLYVR